MAPQPFSVCALGTLHVSAVQAYRAAASIHVWRHSLSVPVPLVLCICPLCRRIMRHVVYGATGFQCLVPLVLCTCPLCRRIMRQVVYGATDFQCLCPWYSARGRWAGVPRGRLKLVPWMFSACALGTLRVSAAQASFTARGTWCHRLLCLCPWCPACGRGAGIPRDNWNMVPWLVSVPSVLCARRCAGVPHGTLNLVPQTFSVRALGRLHVSAVQALLAASRIWCRTF